MVLYQFLKLHSEEEFLSWKWIELRRCSEGWTWYPASRFIENREEDRIRPLAADLDSLVGKLPFGSPVVLCLPEESCFVRHFNVSKTSLPRLGQLAQLDLQRVLPISLEEVVTAVHAKDNGQVLAVEQVVLRRVELLQTIERLTRNGVQVRAVTFRRHDGTWLPAVLDPSGAPFATQSHSRWNRALAASLLAMITAGGFLVATISARTSSQVIRIDAAMVELQPKIDAVKARIASYRETSAAYQQVQDWRTAHDIVLSSIEELSEVLPDHTYLTALTYSSRKIDVDGFSRSPETLISVLEGSELFSGVTFTSPVYRDAGEELSRVSISIVAGSASLANKRP